MNDLQKKDLYFILIFGIIVLVFPIFVNDIYYIHILFMCIIYATLASSLNISVGMTGLSNFAQAAFFGIGAYTAAILNTRFGFPFYLNLFAGGLIATCFGILLGLPTLRLKGVFLALVTEGFGQIMRIIEINWVSVTNGPMGIANIQGAGIGDFTFTKTAYIYCGFLLLLLCTYISKCIIRSKIGRAFFSIKYDETVARSFGVNVTFYKICAYILSSALAGMAGAIFAHYVSFISPDSFTSTDSINILCMVILGGAGTLVGPLLGSIILTVVPEIFRFANLYRDIFIGFVMVFGIISMENNWFVKFKYYIENRLLNRSGIEKS